MKITPDLEKLSHSEPNVQAKVLGVLLGADYRSCFLPRFLERAEVETSADWTGAGSQAVFFTRPVYSYLREQAAAVEDAESAQAEINRFLDLPPTFELRRNTDGKLTHPRGWNSKFVSHMLEDNPDLVGQLGKDRVAAKLWLMEEVANTEVDLILQAGTTTIFCELKWLSRFGPPSQKAALKVYGVDQMHRQYLAGLYLTQAAGCNVHHLVLTSELAGKTRHRTMHTGRLAALIAGAIGNMNGANFPPASTAGKNRSMTASAPWSRPKCPDWPISWPPVGHGTISCAARKSVSPLWCSTRPISPPTR